MTEQLKILFNSEAKNYFLGLNRKFVVDDYNKIFLGLFCKYFSNDGSFETDHNGELRKGLYIYGAPGTGKTSSFKILQNISKSFKINQIWLPIITTQKIVEAYNTSESGQTDYVIKNYSRGKLVLDDLGAETVASNYGKEDIFTRILELRYNEFIDKGTKTFVTSNLDFEGVKQRYGERVYDRCHEMFNLIELTAPENGRRF